MLPDEMLAVIKPRKFGDEEDKLWLFSEMEIFGDNDWVENDPDRGFQFEYFKSPANRVKLDEYGDANNWWERSPNARNSTYFCSVNSYGYANINIASSTTVSYTHLDVYKRQSRREGNFAKNVSE